jgi:predicted metal-dependent phosphoesterase TrpH
MILKKTLIGVMVASMVYCGVKTYKKPEYMDVLKEGAKMKIEAVIDNSPKIKNNEFYIDTHMHLKTPSDYKGIEEIVDKAMEKVDVMVVMIHDTNTSQGLDYDTFKNRIKEDKKYEIKDYGKYVEIKTKYDTLIAIKAQELRTSSGRDVLAIGCDGRIKTNSDIKGVIREIHKQNGIAIIAHPMSIAKDSFFGINIADENERKSLELICYEADALEEFNSQNYLWLLYSNVLAESFIKKHGLPGTAGSDTHYDLEQIGLSGIIVEKDSINMDDFVGDLKKVIKNKKFKLHKEYTSPVKFGKIMAFPLLKSKVESLF